MATQSYFSVSLDRDELLALETFIRAFSDTTGSDAVSSYANLSVGTADYLRQYLNHACSSMEAKRVTDPIFLSLNLGDEEADLLAHWIGRLTVSDIENVVDDADIADTASLALWNLRLALKPMSLGF